MPQAPCSRGQIRDRRRVLFKACSAVNVVAMVRPPYLGVVPSDGHVDLHGHPKLTQVSEPAQGSVKGTGEATESVVRGGVGAAEQVAGLLPAGGPEVAERLLAQCDRRGRGALRGLRSGPARRRQRERRGDEYDGTTNGHGETLPEPEHALRGCVGVATDDGNNLPSPRRSGLLRIRV